MLPDLRCTALHCPVYCTEYYCTVLYLLCGNTVSYQTAFEIMCLCLLRFPKGNVYIISNLIVGGRLKQPIGPPIDKYVFEQLSPKRLLTHQ